MISLLLFGCSKSEIGNQEESPKLDGSSAETAVTEGTSNIATEKVDLEIDTDKFIEESGVMNQLRTDENIYNIEANVLYLINEDFPEIVVSYTYNEVYEENNWSRVKGGDIIIFEKNKISDNWEKIYVYEWPVRIEYIGALNIKDSKLQQPVFHQSEGIKERYRDVLVFIYDENNKEFTEKYINVSSIGSSDSIHIKDNKVIDEGLISEAFTWNGEDFTSEKYPTYTEVTYKEFAKNSMQYENEKVVIKDAYFVSYVNFDEYKERIEFYKYNEDTRKVDRNFPMIEGTYNENNADWFKSILFERKPYAITGTAKKYSDVDMCYIRLDSIFTPKEYNELMQEQY